MIHINTSVLAFHTSLDNQHRNLPYADGRTFRLISPQAKILPFQLPVDSNLPAVTKIEIYNIAKGVARNLTSLFTAAYWKRQVYNDYDIYVYNGNATIAPAMDIGDSYLILTAGSTKFYSDIFTCVASISAKDVLALTYWDDTDLDFKVTQGRISYANNFRNKIYLATKLAKPEYVFEDVVEERDGFKFVEKQIQKKLYKFSLLAPEYLCDVLSLVPMHDNIVIEYNHVVYPVYDILFTPTWLDDGFLANVDAEFSTEAIVKKVGKMFPNYSPGDFNSDFNSDFNVL